MNENKNFFALSKPESAAAPPPPRPPPPETTRATPASAERDGNRGKDQVKQFIYLGEDSVPKSCLTQVEKVPVGKGGNRGKAGAGGGEEEEEGDSEGSRSFW